jgi:phospholipid/cholesterol/gamma-HCH transport system substrate-binding protein
MQNSTVETLIGAVVIAVAALFLFFAYTGSGVGAISGGYDVTARFDRADGVNVGTDVRLSGIKVGTVQKLSLDPKTWKCVLKLAMGNGIKLPDDSSVRITSDGLLGNQYLSIEPGGSMQMIKPGGQIENTQGSIDLIGLLGKFAFSPGPAGSPGAGAAPGGGTGAAPGGGAGK